jgi:hypothetical protein
MSGKRDKGGAEQPLILARKKGMCGSGAQLQRGRKNGWTAAMRKTFRDTLAATCNVSEAARTVGRSLSNVYDLKRRDPAFAREWDAALCVGYDELETLLLRQSLFGAEQEEVVMDGEGAVKSRKVKRGHPHTVAVRLMLAHCKRVDEQRAGQQAERPDGEDAVMRLRLALDAVRGKGDQPVGA